MPPVVASTAMDPACEREAAPMADLRSLGGYARMAPHSVGYTNRVLRSGRRDSTRSQADSSAWSWGCVMPSGVTREWPMRQQHPADPKKPRSGRGRQQTLRAMGREGPGDPAGWCSWARGWGSRCSSRRRSADGPALFAMRSCGHRPHERPGRGGTARSGTSSWSRPARHRSRPASAR